MRLSFCAHNFGTEFDKVVAGLKAIKEIGYEGTEFWQPQIEAIGGVDGLAEAAQDVGLKVAQICAYFNWTGTKEEWEESNRNAERFVEFSKKLGGPHVRVFTGKVGSEEATKEQREACVKGLRAACEAAAPHGICFTLENHQHTLHDTPESALRLIEDVGCDNLGLNFQMWPPFDPLKAIELVYPRIFHMHISNRKNDKIWYIEEGDFNWEPVLKEMKRRGYRGFASVEHAVQPAAEFARRAYDYLAPMVYGAEERRGRQR